MSDVARLRQVLPARSQVPVSWYFDAEHFALEKRLLFDAGANYVGHSLMVPSIGDYHTLAWTDHARMLVRNDAGIDLLSNVCRHRQAIDRKSTRLNPSHVETSYAVFCLKTKKTRPDLYDEVDAAIAILVSVSSLYIT